MKILLTGADGLLGSNLTRLLLERGHIVRAFILPTSESKTLDGLDIERYHGNVLIPETIDNAVSGCDAVIHAAAITNIWPSSSEVTKRVNIEGTRNIVESVLKNKIKRLVYVGSGSSCNTKAKEGEDNDSFPGKKFGLDYINSKYEALKIVMEAAEKKYLPALAVLPTFMIGPYDSLPSSGQMIMAVAKGRMKFYTGGGRNFIHVRDVATAIANSLESSETGKFYIACNENLSYKEFLKKVARITNKPEPKLRAPDWLVKTIGFMGSVLGRLFRFKPLLSYPMACISCQDQFSCTDEAVRHLGMPRTSIDVAIKDCYEWFLENNYLKR